jgi:hypothetical protein
MKNTANIVLSREKKFKMVSGSHKQKTTILFCLSALSEVKKERKTQSLPKNTQKIKTHIT